MPKKISNTPVTKTAVLRNGKYSGTIFLNERSFVKCRTPAVPKAKPNK